MGKCSVVRGEKGTGDAVMREEVLAEGKSCGRGVMSGAEGCGLGMRIRESMVHCGADMIKSLTLGSVCGSGFCQVQFEIADEHRVYSCVFVL